MLPIQKQLIKCNFSSRREPPKYIAIHDTGDPGASAQNEHDYFAGGNRGASADFFVDTNNIIQIIDYLKYYSWHCGDGRGAYGITNSNSIGIEMCLDSNGQPSEATIENTIELTKHLMATLSLDKDHVVRHYDASHKNCPASFSSNNWAKWYDFKSRLNRNGWYKDNGLWYFYSNGSMAKDTWAKDTSGRWFYLGNMGAMVTNGWAEDSSKRWFYLGSDGAMVTDSWAQDSKGWCYLGKDGAWDGKHHENKGVD